MRGERHTLWALAVFGACILGTVCMFAGPFKAPRLLEAFSPIVCDGSRGRIEYTTYQQMRRSGRMSTHHGWEVSCGGRRAPSGKAMLLSLAVYGGAAVGVFGGGMAVGAVFGALARRRRRP